MSVDIDKARAQFKDRWGVFRRFVVRAPGRVNIIGEHTDYNHGFVLPMAIESETVILARKRADRVLNAYAANLDRTTTADLDRRCRDPQENWIDYVIGVADELAQLGKPLHGADMMILGDVPIGCGLSSSASLEMAALCLFEALGGFHLDGAEGPKLGQRVENAFLGLSSGIMDQFISRLGEAGHALFLDCRSLEYQMVPVAFPDAKFVIVNTCVARGLTSSKYNERVQQCGEAVRTMAAMLNKQGTHLRDFSIEDLMACRNEMPEVVFRRARHVITEDDRTKRACEAMRAGNLDALGKFMDQSDASLREDYEVTCPELDAMTSIARSLQGCYGSRMTGAGFGGCTISLVSAGAIETFGERLLAAYSGCTGLSGEIFVSSPAEGAGRIG
jgi:galactokinase